MLRSGRCTAEDLCFSLQVLRTNTSTSLNIALPCMVDLCGSVRSKRFIDLFVEASVKLKGFDPFWGVHSYFRIRPQSPLGHTTVFK